MSSNFPLRPYGSTYGREHLAGKKPRPKTLTVDLHNHMLVPAAADLVKPHLPADHHPASRFTNPLTTEISQAQSRDRKVEFVDIDRRLADIELSGD